MYLVFPVNAVCFLSLKQKQIIFFATNFLNFPLWPKSVTLRYLRQIWTIINTLMMNIGPHTCFLRGLTLSINILILTLVVTATDNKSHMLSLSLQPDWCYVYYREHPSMPLPSYNYNHAKSKRAIYSHHYPTVGW